MSHGASRRVPAQVVVLLAMSLILSACREEDEATLPSVTETAPAAGTTVEWLEPSSREKPAAFLARLTQENEADLEPLLNMAASHYREGPRMIANRVGQLWQDLRHESAAITVATLLTEFTGIGVGPEKSIGPQIQQYRVLRDQGLTHQAAMVSLAESVR